jgi:hypothetical protein
VDAPEAPDVKLVERVVQLFLGHLLEGLHQVEDAHI